MREILPQPAPLWPLRAAACYKGADPDHRAATAGNTMTYRIPLTLSFCSVLALSACVSPDTPPGQNARTGAISGAVLGAALGAATGDGGKEQATRAVVGGIIGAAAGGAIGATLDRQAAELRASLANPNISVTNMGDHLVVNMPQDLLFATDSASLNAALVRDIQAVGTNLAAYPNQRIEVIGHTDNTGTAAWNADLSLRRATSVAQVLIGAGVPAARVSTRGMGEDQPIASNLTPEGRAQNRRVEILIWPAK